jgi:hypothetical protein
VSVWWFFIFNHREHREIQWKPQGIKKRIKNKTTEDTEKHKGK